MNRAFLIVIVALSFCLPWPCLADGPLFFDDDALFRTTDPLADRDEDGLLHQGPVLNRTDFAPRHEYRFMYYFESGETLIADPAYVGALQSALRRRGYYCGAINGVFSNEVSAAIARMEKNYSLTVTGTLTVPVRRALHLP
jgi:peptidoglycan hydrolase-like protein with peptidoglycan-binding domain